MTIINSYNLAGGPFLMDDYKDGKKNGENTGRKRGEIIEAIQQHNHNITEWLYSC